MQAAIIAHVGGLRRWAAQSHFHMALAPLVLQSDAYREFYLEMSRRGDYVVVDNGAAEEKALTMPDILKAARMVRAAEIVLPDVLGSSIQTQVAIMTSLRAFEFARQEYRKMAVPQGETPEAWLECYKAIYDTPNIEVIGLGALTAEMFKPWGGRLGLCNALEMLGLVRTGTEYHLLGLKEDPRNLYEYQRFKWIRSVDTQLPVLCGQYRWEFLTLPFATFQRPCNSLVYLNAVEGGDEQVRVGDLNVALYLSWAKGRTG